METRNHIKMKLGDEENSKLFILNNPEINNDSKNNVQYTKIILNLPFILIKVHKQIQKDIQQM